MIQKWRELTDKITVRFIEKYFECRIDNVNWFWVNDDTAQVFCIGDYYLSFSDAVYCLEKNVDKDKFFEYYDYSLEHYPIIISLSDFILSPEIREEKHKQYLEELKERVKTAEDTLKQAIENYGN